MKANDKPTNGVSAMTNSMLIVMALTTISKVSGFLREMLQSAKFGANAVNSALNTAVDVPCLFLSVITIAMATALIPVYTDRMREGKASANRFMNNLLTIGMGLSVVVLVFTAVFAQPLIDNILIPKSSPEVKQLALELTRLMLPMGIFVFLARVCSAYLQANSNFTVPAVSQILLNLVVIVAIMLSGPDNATYVAIGTVIGWAVQFFFHIPWIRRQGLSYRPTVDVKEPGLAPMMLLMLPIIVSGAFDQLILSVNRAVISSVEADIVHLGNASKLSTMVSAVLLTTIATVLYPSFVRHAAERDKMASDLSFGININLLIALPATAALLLLNEPLTRLTLGRGNYSSESVEVTAAILACFAPGILGLGLRELFNRAFYAHKNTVIPTVVGIGTVLLNVALDYALYEALGVAGVAIAGSIAALIGAALLLFLLSRKYSIFHAKRVVSCLWKTGLSTLLMSVPLFLLAEVAHLGTASGFTLLIDIGGLFVVGVAVYLLALFLLREEAFMGALAMVKSKLRRNNTGTGT